MTTVIKLIVALILKYTLGQNIPIATFQEKDSFTTALSITKDPKKTNAFVILNTKCNTCHRKRNKRRVFTEENMNNQADDVYKQVFIKKRMPKGNIKLTSKEYQELLTWISSIKNNKNGNKI